ncbi:phage terminase large subunit family protein [Dongia deserti]|uniref:phage terminase large subunit family protein n=1 Tax=Dongia deserti TaxID=2268030 RepID=UPI000E65A24D|nr:terminase family protein [Dongia deserti]
MSGYFLPYQAKWIADQSRFKIWEKSRRIGATYGQSYEDVIDASKADKPIDVWFTSADDSAAAEYIRYCEMWTRLYDIAAQDLGEIVIDRKDDIKARTIEFATGKRIHGLSSNPKAFRSKGGKLVIDEYAFHAQPEELWKAALPIITWGYPVRVLSTYNGKGNRYYRMVVEAKKENNWSLHTTTIAMAVEQGLADKILGRALTAEERAAWLQEQRDAAGDEETWLQEFMCQPVDEATAWLTWELITANEHPDAGKPEHYQRGPCYVGWDIGRKRDLSVMWVDELVGDVMWAREVVDMHRKTFAEQDAEFDRLMGTYDVRRACIDQTGMGEKVVEDAKKRHGEYKVEGVMFTLPAKQDLATRGKQMFEDKRTRIPPTRTIRESHHAVRKMTTVSGAPRFDAERSEAIGHADHFWAHMLALLAGANLVPPAAGSTIESKREDLRPASMPERPAVRMFGRTFEQMRGIFRSR